MVSIFAGHCSPREMMGSGGRMEGRQDIMITASPLAACTPHQKLLKSCLWFFCQDEGGWLQAIAPGAIGVRAGCPGRAEQPRKIPFPCLYLNPPLRPGQPMSLPVAPHQEQEATTSEPWPLLQVPSPWGDLAENRGSAQLHPPC